MSFRRTLFSARSVADNGVVCQLVLHQNAKVGSRSRTVLCNRRPGPQLRTLRFSVITHGFGFDGAPGPRPMNQKSVRPDNLLTATLGSTSQSMLDRVSLGSDEDRRLLITLYSSLVLNRYIDWRVVENPEDRQDITSRVFQAVFRRIERQGFERQGRGAFRGWLKITTKNKVGDFIRRERRRRGKSQALAEQRAHLLADAGEIGDEATDENTERALLIRQAIEVVRAEFEPASYEMARLQLLDGSSAVEAGTSCGKSANAAYIAKCRVKRRLRELLDRFEIWETESDPSVDRPGGCS